ncbi:MAG: phage tail tip lysozyme [Clostridia bacterium]|nr:phage tail tip lysozyme [Clostridia bacterium]
MKKFITCITLSIMMVLSLIPQVAFADDVTVKEGGVITGFAEMETTDYYYEGNPEEEELTLNLPETLGVYIDGNAEITDIAVSWEAVEDFENTDFYFYSMKPVWGEEFTLSPELSVIMDVPWITVYKQEPENTQIEPMLTEEEIEPVYTEEEGPVDPETYEEGFVEETVGAIRSLLVEEVYAATTAENTAAIYKYLTKTMGLNTAAACGVMTNINAESAMSPINLQNSYERSLGYRDSSYTKAVDKGTYKRFASDSAGYGLCQWTSNGRKAKLLSYAKAKNTSIGSLKMQMSFFHKELKESYESVYTTLKNVPNNASGAYIAATEMCMCYEIPYDTVNTAASRGKTCLSNYWKTYSGSAASVKGTSFITLCGYTYPTAVRNGKGMDVKGYAISNYTVTSLTGKIINSKGKTVYSKTVYPGTTAARLSALDNDMKFSKLSNGTYTYKITAKDKLGKYVTTSHKFTVSSSGSTTKALGFASIGGTAATTPVTVKPEETKPANSDGKLYTGTLPKLPFRGYFKKGDKGTQVKYLQKCLNWAGCKATVDGSYGNGTVEAVKKLQKKLGLKADGQFGKQTLEKFKKLRM